MCSSPHLWFLHAKQRILDQNFKSLWVPALICGFCMPNSEFWLRITSLYGPQTSPALVCNQNGVICTGISSLYWFQPSSVVLCLQNSDFRTRPHLWICAIKTATLQPELHVCMGPSLHQVFCAFNTACLPQDLQVPMGPRLWICECKTVCLAQEYQVCMGPSPHLWICAFKTSTL